MARSQCSGLDEITAINQEAGKLKAQGINIIVALGHSGYKKDKEIAKNCPEVDVVVGGHSNSFLYSPVNSPPSNEQPVGPYPTWITQSNGKVVPVVQAYAYTKYLGFLKLIFDDNGVLIQDRTKGNPILLDHNKPQGDRILKNPSVLVYLCIIFFLQIHQF